MSKEITERKRGRAVPSPSAFAYTVADAQSMGLPGKTTIYKLIKAGRLRVIKQDGFPTMLNGDDVRALLGQE